MWRAFYCLLNGFFEEEWWKSGEKLPIGLAGQDFLTETGQNDYSHRSTNELILPVYGSHGR
jgi:hypothetical protein